MSDKQRLLEALDEMARLRQRIADVTAEFSEFKRAHCVSAIQQVLDRYGCQMAVKEGEITVMVRPHGD